MKTRKEVFGTEKPIIGMIHLSGDGFDRLLEALRLYYLIGSDNLAMFLRSKRLAEFLEDFHFAVVVRDGDDTTPVLMANEIAWARKERFAIIPSPLEKGGISSTAVREMFRTGGTGAVDMLHRSVLELMKEVNIWANE